MNEAELEKQLKSLVDSFQNDTDCIHVSWLLRDLYPDSQTNLEDMLTRGKVIHYAIEHLLQRMYGKNAIIEKKHKIDYENVKLCYTPDVIIQNGNYNTLIEIKTSQRSFEYALYQTSIYRFLLQQEEIKIDECLMITGDLKVKYLFCNAELGKEVLTKKLKSVLI